MTKSKANTLRDQNRDRQTRFVERLIKKDQKIVRMRAHVDDESLIKAYAAKLRKKRGI